jgi:SAM-dependent methyltransferase
MTMSRPNTEEIDRLVVAEFSSKPVVDHFTSESRSGFWPSEEALIERYFKPGSRVLDLGCGAGRTTLPLIRAGFEVIGIDISEAMITAARNLASEQGLPAQFEVGDALKLQFGNNTFDQVIFSNQGWTQIPGTKNRIRALCEIRRVLVDGGVLLFSTHTRPRAVFHPRWGWRWIRWYVRKAFGMRCLEMDFGDLLFVRSLPVAHNMKQYVHIPTMRYVKALLRARSFELVETKREHGVRHKPLLYIAKKALISPGRRAV